MLNFNEYYYMKVNIVTILGSIPFNAVRASLFFFNVTNAAILENTCREFQKRGSITLFCWVQSVHSEGLFFYEIQAEVQVLQVRVVLPSPF